MKNCLFCLAICLSVTGWSQSICGQAFENGSITLTAPSGNVFTSIAFASYGTPDGTCGAYTVGACNASNSKQIVEGEFLGKNTATISATNGVFGDPCGGTVKRLYIQAVYSTVLPLRLLSITGFNNNKGTIIQWKTSDEENTSSFNIERSIDGSHFSEIGTVKARNNSGLHSYSFNDNFLSRQTYYYRLKMLDQDGRFTISRTLIVKPIAAGILTVYPNPVTSNLHIEGSNKTGYVEIIGLGGTIIEKIPLTTYRQIINVAGYLKGVYTLKSVTNQGTEYQKIIKL